MIGKKEESLNEIIYFPLIVLKLKVGLGALLGKILLVPNLAWI